MRRTASNRRIESPDNELVRRLRRLATRREPGRVLLEGPGVVREAVGGGIRLEVLALREGATLDVPADRTVTLSERAFAALSQTITPRGVLAVARTEPVPLSRALAAARGRWPAAGGPVRRRKGA